MWPIVKYYVHPDSKYIQTDGEVWYKGIETIFNNAEHHVVYHNKCFVDKDNSDKHINGIENRNRWLKASIKSRRNRDMVWGYIKMWTYFTHTFKPQCLLAKRWNYF